MADKVVFEFLTGEVWIDWDRLPESVRLEVGGKRFERISDAETRLDWERK